MKTKLPWLIPLAFLLWFLGSARMPADKEFSLNLFGSLPVVFNGRHQPLDSIARNALLALHGKQTANLEPWKGVLEGPRILSATEWLLTVMANPEVTDQWPLFRVDHPEVISLLGLPDKDREKQSDGKHYAWTQVASDRNFQLMQTNSAVAEEKKTEVRTPFDQAILRLNSAMTLYFRLKNSIQPQDAKDWAAELAALDLLIPPGIAAARASEAGRPYDTNALEALLRPVGRMQVMSRLEPPLVIPPQDPVRQPENWTRTGEALMSHIRGEPLPAAVSDYAAMVSAFRQGRGADFNQAVGRYHDRLQGAHSQEILKTSREQFFNHLAPFYKAMVIYVAAFLLAVCYWFNFSEWARRSAFGLIGFGFLIHTLGLLFRMWLEGRPPVTNLYSSAIFIGWGAIVLGMLLERFWRNSIGLVVASAIGFITLVIAHNLSLKEDTLQMMEAVLDTNFWLATHVVIVTLGYASTFVAGFLAMVYIVRGFFTKSLDVNTGRSLARMVYGIVCFATLFSFVGTVLGGIWADQSWGRFWGWDPKENGALIIVLWNAMILHARWGALVKDRGLMCMAIAGNIVTAWSWFGVNMLGIGLHSYGWMSGAFKWLALFVVSQLLLIAIGFLPPTLWRSNALKPTTR